MRRIVTLGPWAAPLSALLIAISPALGSPHAATAVAAPQAARSASSASAIIDGTIAVSIASPTLKHWGVPAAEAVFVPASDQSASAQAIRSARDADALCDAIARAVGRDPAIAAAPVDGDGDLQHRSGDVASLSFRLTISGAASSTRGALYLCSRPIIAVVSRGAYPNERFEPAEGHRLSWQERPVDIHPGQETRVNGTASLDASQW